MHHYFSHLRNNWILAAAFAGAVILIVYPDPFVDSLHWILGGGFLIYAAANVVRRAVFHVQTVRYGDCLVKAILALIVMFMRHESIAIIGVIWALWSLEEAGREIDDAVRTQQFSLFSFFLLLTSIALSILLIMDPFEHITMHVQYVGIEIIAIILLSRNNTRQ